MKVVSCLEELRESAFMLFSFLNVSLAGTQESCLESASIKARCVSGPVP